MLCEESHEDGWCSQGSAGSPGLGWSDNRSPSASCDLFSDGDGRPVEVDAADAETGALAPTKPEHRPQIDHRPVLRPQGVGEIRQLVPSEHGSVGRLDRR
jgi:hypothetical protein